MVALLDGMQLLEIYIVKMESKLIGIIGAGILLLIASFVQVGDTSLEPTHYCLNKEIKAYCYSLYDSKVTCYTQPEKTGGKQCRGGQWEEISEEEEIPQITKSTSGRLHCTSKGCS